MINLKNNRERKRAGNSTASSRRIPRRYFRTLRAARSGCGPSLRWPSHWLRWELPRKQHPANTR